MSIPISQSSHPPWSGHLNGRGWDTSQKALEGTTLCGWFQREKDYFQPGEGPGKKRKRFSAPCQLCHDVTDIRAPLLVCCCQRLKLSCNGSSRWKTPASLREGSLRDPLQQHYKDTGGKSRLCWHGGLLQTDATSRKKWQMSGTFIQLISSHSLFPSLGLTWPNPISVQRQKGRLFWCLIPHISWNSSGLSGMLDWNLTSFILKHSWLKVSSLRTHTLECLDHGHSVPMHQLYSLSLFWKYAHISSMFSLSLPPLAK